MNMFVVIENQNTKERHEYRTASALVVSARAAVSFTSFLAPGVCCAARRWSRSSKLTKAY
jgi:hypothetical protein